MTKKQIREELNSLNVSLLHLFNQKRMLENSKWEESEWYKYCLEEIEKVDKKRKLYQKKMDLIKEERGKMSKEDKISGKLSMEAALTVLKCLNLTCVFECDTHIAFKLSDDIIVKQYGGSGHGYLVIKDGKLDSMRYADNITDEGETEQNIDCTDVSNAISLESGLIRIEGDFSCGEFIFYKYINTDYEYDDFIIREVSYYNDDPDEYYFLIKNENWLDEFGQIFKSKEEAKKYALDYLRDLKKPSNKGGQNVTNTSK